MWLSSRASSSEISECSRAAPFPGPALRVQLPAGRKAPASPPGGFVLLDGGRRQLPTRASPARIPPSGRRCPRSCPPPAGAFSAPLSAPDEVFTHQDRGRFVRLERRRSRSRSRSTPGSESSARKSSASGSPSSSPSFRAAARMTVRNPIQESLGRRWPVNAHADIHAASQYAFRTACTIRLSRWA